MPKILVVDDNPDILDALDLLLHLHGYDVVCAQDVKSALMASQNQAIDLVIQDMNFSLETSSGDEGKSLFYQLRQNHPDLPIVLMTAWTQLETAVELVKAGAIDYLPKPWSDEKLLATIAQHTSQSQSNDSTALGHSPMIYRSEAMNTLVQHATRVAKADVNVLITGPNGSGKEKLADYMHQQSNRADAAFIKVNVGALPDQLMEAELFGAEKGAFTGANSQRIGRFEAADNGTLFLDEIGNLSLSGQMKLLRVLQTGEFERLGSNTTLKSNVRVVCATNEDLPRAVRQGKFREDLYFRLNVIELNIPPLCERKDDILPLVRHFIGDDKHLTKDAENALRRHTWPGNVRELQNACARALVFASSSELNAGDFQMQAAQLEDDDRSRVAKALEEHQWVIKKAADALGLSRQSLYRRIEKYNLEQPS